MKALKVILGILVGLVVLAGALGFFLPSRWVAERSTVVNAPPAAVYPWVASFKRWDEWNPFVKGDPTLKLSHSGPEEGVGAVESWESRKMGPGSMTMVKAEPGKEVAYELAFSGNRFSLGGHVLLEPVGGGTRVTWRDEGELGANPFRHYMAPVLSGAIGAAFAQGLATLKGKVEAAPPAPAK